MIRIWGRASAFNLQKAYWALLETGQPYERLDAGGDFGGLDSPDFLARNPNGRIPVIDDNGFVLWESQAIVRYLAEQHAPALVPNDVQGRALASQWMDWAQTILLPAALDLFWGGCSDAQGKTRCGVCCARLEENHFRAHTFGQRAFHPRLSCWRQLLSCGYSGGDLPLSFFRDGRYRATRTSACICLVYAAFRPVCLPASGHGAL